MCFTCLPFSWADGKPLSAVQAFIGGLIPLVSMGFFFFILFFVIQFLFLPFFIVFLSFLRSKIFLHHRQKNSRKWFKLIFGNIQVVGLFAFFRQPIKLPPYPLNSKTIIKIICTTSSIGVNQKKKVWKRLCSRYSFRCFSITLPVSSISFLTAFTASSTVEIPYCLTS